MRSMVCSHSGSVVRFTTMRWVSWQVVQRSLTSDCPSPAGKSRDTLLICSSGTRYGHAGGRIVPCLLASARSIFALLPPSTVTGADLLLSKPAPMPWTVYWPGGRSPASKRPWSWLTTMKVRWRSALMSFTMAPATGCPAASLTTPCTTPRSSAAWAAAAMAPKAALAARYRVKFLNVMCFPPGGSSPSGTSPFWTMAVLTADFALSVRETQPHLRVCLKYRKSGGA